MSNSVLLRLLLLVFVLSSCTFGEGPELEVPESDDTTDVDVREAASETDPAIEDQNLASETPGMQVPSTEQTGQQPEPETESTTNAGIQQGIDSNADVNAPIPMADDDTLGTIESGNETAQLNIVRIPRTDAANAPRINGDTVDYVPGTELLGGEWMFAAQKNAGGVPLDINKFMFGAPEQAFTGGHNHWAAMHDGEYLYLAIVSDDNGMHFQDTNEQRKPWKDDSVELYFDGNHSRLEEYDGVDDFQFIVNLLTPDGSANDSSSVNPMIRTSEYSAILPSDLIFSAGPRKGPRSTDPNRTRKDIYEFRIKLSELNIEIEQPFGFEIQLNDDDDGGTRDSKWAWAHPKGEDAENDYTWQNPSYMGTAILVR